MKSGSDEWETEASSEGCLLGHERHLAKAKANAQQNANDQTRTMCHGEAAI
ncbi:hypothetical protein RISK_000556 [Rhodopirellula islandica]|uniref:Uncharacterized protein n=1 Tax=Rhodopirellula islandica TaxID=595434 RepID=A0A0J1BLZ4_RHOIS|nr:hypothetical protein RISK_000556 [Rhodopirellula islandica]